MAQGTYVSGPAIGIENGTLLVGWPCRRVPATADGSPPVYNMTAVAAHWTSEGTLCVAVLESDGRAGTHPFDMLQFDPEWSRD